MAKRRCLSADVLESDAYLSLSSDAKALYVGFIMHADDEGVVINPKVVMRILRTKPKTIDEILDEGLIIKVGEILVIKHWYVHNRIQPSKFTPSLYSDEIDRLYVNSVKEYELMLE